MKSKLFSILIFLISIKGNAQSFLNSSLETWGPENVCDVNSPPFQWNNFSSVGIAPDEGNLFLYPSTIPTHASEGHVYARMMAGSTTSGEGMAQAVTGFNIGASYTLSFDYAGSNLYGGTGDITFHVFKDNVQVDSTIIFHSTDTAWATHNYQFTATSTSHTFGFRLHTAPPPQPGGSGGIDNFLITQITGINSLIVIPDITVTQNPFHNSIGIAANKCSDCEVTLTDITSRCLLHRTFSCSIDLNTEELPTGLYFFSVTNKSGIIKTGKLIKN